MLVCDDERHIVRLIQVSLERQGCEATCVHGGREAIACLERETFDLAVVDRDMPDMSGDEVLAWIRADERTRSMRVVLLDKDGRGGDGPNAGATRFLTKPFNPALVLDW